MRKRFLMPLVLVALALAFMLGRGDRVLPVAHAQQSPTAATAICYSGTASATLPSSWIAGVTGKRIFLQSLTITTSTAGSIGIWENTTLIYSVNLLAGTPYNVPASFFFGNPGSTGGADDAAGPDGFQLPSGHTLNISDSAGSAYCTTLAAQY